MNRENNELLASQQFKRFDNLDTDARSLLEELLNNRSVFKNTLQTQALTLTQLHLETKDLIRHESHQTRSEIISAIQDTSLHRTKLQGKVTRLPQDCKPSWADIILDTFASLQCLTDMRASKVLIKTHSNGSFTKLVIRINRRIALHSGLKLEMASIGYLGKLDRVNQPL
jgi:hypothetical protein